MKKFNSWLLKGKKHVAYFPYNEEGREFAKFAAESLKEFADNKLIPVFQINKNMIDGIIRERTQ